MVIVISTPSVHGQFEDSLSRALPVARWRTVSAVPLADDRLLDLAGVTRHGKGQLIVFKRYGRAGAERFPPVCIGGWVVALVFYRSPADIARWIGALGGFDRRLCRDTLVMGMMKPFYVKWAERFHRELQGADTAGARIEKRLPDTTTRSELSDLLSRGLKLGIYIGHGRSRGWSGYRGFRWEHVEEHTQSAPIGSMISLSCSSLKQDKVASVPSGLNWIMSGRCCAFFGACDAVKIQPLVHIARIMLELLSSPSVARLDELLRLTAQRVALIDEAEVADNWARFRLIGNPLQPLD